MHRVISVRIWFLAVLALLLAACGSSADLPDADGAAVVEYVLDTAPYREWETWPADQ